MSVVASVSSTEEFFARLNDETASDETRIELLVAVRDVAVVVECARVA